MKYRLVASLAALIPFALVPFFAVHCGNGAAPDDAGLITPTSTATGSGTGTGTQPPPMMEAGAPSDGGDAGDAGTPPPAGFYVPTGCQYGITELTSRGYTNVALDDQTQPSDASGAAPVRVRVGLRGNTTKGAAGYADPTTTAAFIWETAAQTSNARVRYALSSAGLASGASVQTGFVYEVPMSGVGGSEGPTYFHEADVCGLTPGTTYYYQVGGGAAGQEIWSATQSFATVPAMTATAGDAGGPILVGVFGDARDTVGTWQMVNQRMTGSGASILLISGDIVDLGIDETLFTEWLNAIWTNSTSGTGFLTLGQFIMVPINGNHENESSQFYANFAIPGQGTYANTYASFDVGSAHFVMIDDQEIGTSPSSAEAAAQLAWIESDLAAANADRANRPFIVAVSHRGMYSTSYHATDSDVIAARASLAPLYDKYHVNLSMNGHDHEYERSKELNAGSPASGPPVVVDGGTTYVINAGAGADPYPVASFAGTYRQGNATGLGNESDAGVAGCYVLLSLEPTKMTLTAYGMESSGGSVAGDTVIDTMTWGQ